MSKRSRFGTTSYFRKEHQPKKRKKHRKEIDGKYPYSEKIPYPYPTGKIHEPETPYPRDFALIARAGRIKIKVDRLQHKGKRPAQQKNIENFLYTPEQRTWWNTFNVAQGAEPYKIWIRRHQRAKKALIKSGIPAHLVS